LDLSARPPGSKSISNRALLLAAVADGRSILRGMLDAEDTQVMRACLGQLGVRVETNGDAWTVDGLGEQFGASIDGPAPLFVATAGTAARFLTATIAATAGPAVQIDGSPRMRQRPMAQLLGALQREGIAFEFQASEGFLPFRIPARGQAWAGGTLSLSRPDSSQFVSALVFAATRASRPARIELTQGTPARPYVEMTLAMVEQFGGRAGWEATDVIRVEPAPLLGRDYTVEPDASAASYFLALAAIHGGRVVIPTLGAESLQGDAGFCRVLERMGARVEQGAKETSLENAPLHGIEVDLSDMPDMTLTAAVVSLFAQGPTRIRGVEILRHHESDRLAAGATELRKLGAEVEELEDGLAIVPPPSGPARGVAIDTYDDHRMAMAFATVGDVVINDPACVGKTFPGYFERLAALGMIAND
jgi:3-phosphoshikimate 1-carboxyvinyltransferase